MASIVLLLSSTPASPVPAAIVALAAVYAAWAEYMYVTRGWEEAQTWLRN